MFLQHGVSSRVFLYGSLYPFFNLIVIRPMCDSEWSLLCHSILTFCFTSLFLLCKNMTYFSLCTDYFVWVTCTEIKWTESTVDTSFSPGCYYSISLFFYSSPSAEVISLAWIRKTFILMRLFSLSPHSSILLVNLQSCGCVGCFSWYLFSICRVSPNKLSF